MRLINTTTLQLEEFLEREKPPYAVLSHTWEGAEVNFEDFYAGLCKKDTAAYKKIEKTCELARRHRLEWAWVDTCCIDKRSSSELSEAINSMYEWYKNAVICYAYLADLPIAGERGTELKDCKWFTRGWTLQELIANANVDFYDGAWNYRGSKKDLAHTLAKITQVDEGLLNGTLDISNFCVAQKMSWASGRNTKRVEDEAYCLLGLFDVNIPLLYGQGKKAFQVLQEEIIRSTADFSIFAWTKPARTRKELPPDRIYCGLLASSPEDFAEYRNLGFRDLRQDNFDLGEFSSTNVGLKSRVPTLSLQLESGRQLYILRLKRQAAFVAANDHLVGVKLRKCGADVFVRDDPWSLYVGPHNVTQSSPRERYYLARIPPQFRIKSKDDGDYAVEDFIKDYRPFTLQVERPPAVDVHDAWPWERFDAEDQAFFAVQSARDCCMMRLSMRFEPAVYEGFDFVFYGCGWSSPNLEDIQCTVIKYKPNAEAINEVQAQITEWDDNRKEVLARLEYCHIPKCSGLVYDIPGTEYSVHVSYTLTPTGNTPPPGSRSQSSWKVIFKTHISQTGSMPAIPSELWTRESRGYWV